MSSPPCPSWLYLLIGALSLAVVKIVFRYRTTGAETDDLSGMCLGDAARVATERLRDADTALERSLT